MSDRVPPTETVPAADLPARWAELLERAQHEARLLIAQDGRPIAALVSARDLERLLRYEAGRIERFRAIERIGEAFADVPDDVLDREVETAVAAARTELRAAREAEAVRLAHRSA